MTTAMHFGRAWLADATLVRQRAGNRGARSPLLSAAADPSLWALTLLRGAGALRATIGSSLGLSTVLRMVFHIDVWTDDIGPGLRFPHPFGIVVGGGAALGANCTLLHGVTIAHGKGTSIGDGAVLCAGVTVLAGSKVGEGALVGANSVVRGGVPAGMVAVGSPARVVRHTLVARNATEEAA